MMIWQTSVGGRSSIEANPNIHSSQNVKQRWERWTERWVMIDDISFRKSIMICQITDKANPNSYSSPKVTRRCKGRAEWWVSYFDTRQMKITFRMSMTICQITDTADNHPWRTTTLGGQFIIAVCMLSGTWQGACCPLPADTWNSVPSINKINYGTRPESPGKYLVFSVTVRRGIRVTLTDIFSGDRPSE